MNFLRHLKKNNIPQNKSSRRQANLFQNEKSKTVKSIEPLNQFNLMRINDNKNYP